MYISRVRLKNWRNFTAVNVRLARRVFLLGNNGVGKSNFMDALRFLRDIADEDGGGLQSAIKLRGGIRRIRSLHARRDPVVAIGVEITDENEDGKTIWDYELVVKQEQGGTHRVLVESEIVHKNGVNVLNRPDADDEGDRENLKQTALEQVRENKKFRELFAFLQKISYLHMVPQLVRNAEALQAKILPNDPYGQNLFNEMAQIPVTVRNARLRVIGSAMKSVKSNFDEFKFVRDEANGTPHLIYKYKDWRSHGTYHDEMLLSDGELRLIGLLWALLKDEYVQMLEEPELSFNEKIIEDLPSVFAKVVSKYKKKGVLTQMIISTHNSVLLSDKDINAKEILLLQQPKKSEGTKIVVVNDKEEFVNLLDAGLNPAEVLLPHAQSYTHQRLDF